MIDVVVAVVDGSSCSRHEYLLDDTVSYSIVKLSSVAIGSACPFLFHILANREFSSQSVFPYPLRLSDT